MICGKEVVMFRGPNQKDQKIEAIGRNRWKEAKSFWKIS